MFALLACTLHYIGQYSRKIILPNKQLQKFQSSDFITYQNTKRYHVFNHLTQGFALGAIQQFIDLVLDSAEAIGFTSKLARVVTNFGTSASFTTWGMFRMRFYKDFVIDLSMKNRARPNVIAVWKEVTNYILYIVTAVVVLDLMGIEYVHAVRAISTFGGIGKFVVQ